VGNSIPPADAVISYKAYAFGLEDRVGVYVHNERKKSEDKLNCPFN